MLLEFRAGRGDAGLVGEKRHLPDTSFADSTEEGVDVAHIGSGPGFIYVVCGRGLRRSRFIRAVDATCGCRDADLLVADLPALDDVKSSDSEDVSQLERELLDLGVRKLGGSVLGKYASP